MACFCRAILSHLFYVGPKWKSLTHGPHKFKGLDRSAGAQEYVKSAAILKQSRIAGAVPSEWGRPLFRVQYDWHVDIIFGIL